MLLAVSTIVVAAALLLVAVIRPRLLVHNGGRWLGFVAIFVFPLLATMAATGEHVERSKTTKFCLSCHVMEKYGESLRIDDPRHVPAMHFQNARVPQDRACYECHTTYTMYGPLKSKLKGLEHVWVNYFGTVPAPEKIKLYEPYNNRECLHCHNGQRPFEEASAHHDEADTMARIKSNQTSCLTKGCHQVTHDLENLGKVKLWNGVAMESR